MGFWNSRRYISAGFLHYSRVVACVLTAGVLRLRRRGAGGVKWLACIVRTNVSVSFWNTHTRTHSSSRIHLLISSAFCSPLCFHSRTSSRSASTHFPVYSSVPPLPNYHPRRRSTATQSQPHAAHNAAFDYIKTGIFSHLRRSKPRATSGLATI